MNFLLHFLIAYLAIENLFGNASQYIIQIFVFSNILDMDHLPYLLRVKHGVFRRKFGSESRSRFHELYGVALISFAISAISFFDMALAKVIALSVILHHAGDFLVGRSRPFYPFSGKEVFMDMLPVKYRAHFEVMATFALGSVFLWSLLS